MTASGGKRRGTLALGHACFCRDRGIRRCSGGRGQLGERISVGLWCSSGSGSTELAATFGAGAVCLGGVRGGRCQTGFWGGPGGR